MIRRRMSALLTVALLLLAAPPVLAQAPVAGPERFLPELAVFAAKDAAAPPAPCQVLFVGSSSVRFWRSLEQDMAPIPVLNRGFGGSKISDVNLYFDRVVSAYRPRAIFFYAGDNDIHAGQSPAAVVAAFEAFMDLKTKALGATPVYFISLKPSVARWPEKGAQDTVNDTVRALADQRADLDYIDIVSPMLDAKGQPKPIFVGDGLHMTPDGYVLWTQAVAPVVRAAPACRAP